LLKVAKIFYILNFSQKMRTFACRTVVDWSCRWWQFAARSSTFGLFPLLSRRLQRFRERRELWQLLWDRSRSTGNFWV
jgi:hypothetical protein